MNYFTADKDFVNSLFEEVKDQVRYVNTDLFLDETKENVKYVCENCSVALCCLYDYCKGKAKELVDEMIDICDEIADSYEVDDKVCNEKAWALNFRKNALSKLIKQC